MKCCLSIFATSSLLALAAGAAHAQSSPTTCAMDQTLDELLVISVNGRTTTVESTASGILVNGVFCGWQGELDRVLVQGGGLADRVTMRGAFTPGRLAELDWDELEVRVELGGGSDTLTIEFSEIRDQVLLSGEFMNVNDDDDVDWEVFAELVTLKGMGGNDLVIAQPTVAFTAVQLYGGDGNDQLRGSSGNDLIDGEAGNDLLVGNGGDDVLIGGPGSDVHNGGDGVDTVDYRARTAPITVTIGNGLADDGEVGELDSVPGDIEVVLGGKGADVLVGSALANTLNGGGGNDRLDGGFGPDLLIGGPGIDTVDYSGRFATVGVYIGDGLADDGELDEGDNVDGTVENATGGAANDVLVGTAVKNILRGGPGNDSLTGEDGNDILYGDDGDDSILAGPGADRLYGGAGSDVLDGMGGIDTFAAGGGDDFLYNDDGAAETVNCGPGTDDAEVDTGAVDTFIGCEL